MAATFSYRPKYVDIRVKRPASAAKERTAAERACDHTDCTKAGAHKAPKSRDRTNEFWWFCAEHAGEYNRRWDFFKDMTDEEYSAFKSAEEIGHRPTWAFKPGKGDRVGASKFWEAGKKADAFNMFGPETKTARARTRAEPRKPRMGRLQVLALNVLALEEGADAATIRTRYTEMVKRYHPDVNQGDRTAETQLNRVLKAYQTLKAAGLA